MRETFPDLHKELMLYSDAVNPYEEFITDNVQTDVKVNFIKLAKRCLRISSKLKVKALNIETLFCRKYLNISTSKHLPTPKSDDVDEPLSELNTDKYKILCRIVFEVKKRCGMPGLSANF